MSRIWLALPLVAALATAGTTASAAPARPAVHLAPPSRLLFHALSDGQGYWAQAPLTGNGPAHRLFGEAGEPLAAVATRHAIVWITEPSNPADTEIVIASDTGAGERVLVHHVPAAPVLVTAGRYVYWGGPHWIGRIRLNGTHLRRYFIRIPIKPNSGSADGMTTDGQYLYFTQCLAGRIGQVPIAPSGRAPGVHWLVIDPGDGGFCPQAVAYSNGHLFYADDSGIGRIATSGAGRDDTWFRLRFANQPGDLVADSSYLYWDTCAASSCASAHVARMTTSGQHLQLGLYDHVDQGLTLAP